MVGLNMSYPDVHSRADIEISSPMKIHGNNGSKGTCNYDNNHKNITPSIIIITYVYDKNILPNK